MLLLHGVKNVFFLPKVTYHKQQTFYPEKNVFVIHVMQAYL